MRWTYPTAESVTYSSMKAETVHVLNSPAEKTLCRKRTSPAGEADEWYVTNCRKPKARSRLP